VNDGEWGKPSYATYIKDRLNGFGGAGNTYVFQDIEAFPQTKARVMADPGRKHRKAPACDAPISVRDMEAPRKDAERLKTALKAHGAAGAFLTAASPGVTAFFFRNEYYRTHEDIVDVVWKAKPHAIQFEAANPRHAHEWAVFETVKVPEGKVLIPGVIECQSNYIEHPELVAQRVERYANLVGRDNVMAGVDCGFSIHVGSGGVDPDVVWAKLGALAEGAAIASRRLWG